MALKSQYPVLAIFIFDFDILNNLTSKKDNRVAFILEALRQINTELVETGSSLYVLHDTPVAAFEKLTKEFEIRQVFTNNDYEPYAITRDKKIKDYLASKNISFHLYKDQVIFEEHEIIKTDGKPYTVYTPYSKMWKQKLEAESPIQFASEECLTQLLKKDPFPFPSLQDIGFETVEYKIPSMDIADGVIKNYHETRNLPGVSGTSEMSVHLRFGTVSVRRLVNLAKQFNEKWLNELIWREFFMMILFHFPSVVNHSFKKKYDKIAWRNADEEFKLWCKGETGYPLVDAGMRQLNETGRMHNRVRLVVASFLVKHLLIDWRWGEAFFAEKLLDYELASNNGNWQWAAGSGCDAAPYFRVFNPHIQTKKFDPEFVYIKTWIKDYKPGYLPEVVEHEFARKRALEVYKRSLAE